MNEKRLLAALEKDAFADREQLAKALKCTRDELDDTIKRLEEQKGHCRIQCHGGLGQDKPRVYNSNDRA